MEINRLPRKRTLGFNYTAGLRRAISLGAILAAVNLVSVPAVAQPKTLPRILVTNTNDSGPGSLRDAVVAANEKPNSVIAFNIARDDANFQDGVFSIKLKSTLPPLKMDGTVVDGAAQIVATGNTNEGGPVVQILGDIEVPEGRRTTTSGLTVNGSNCIVNALLVNKFTYGILLGGARATGCQVRSCYIGTNNTATGASEATGNGSGIRIQDGAAKNRIGGQTPVERNIIAGNGRDIMFAGAGTVENVVEGNYIGTDRSGTKVISKGRGVVFELDGGRNLIGGAKPEARNVINTMGGYALYIGGEKQQGNLVQGNYIGTDKTGAVALERGGHGVFIINPQPKTMIGGEAPGVGNLIAPYKEASVYCSYTAGITIQGNMIGVNAAGTHSLGAGGNGIFAYETSNLQIGGTSAAARNVIGGDLANGIHLLCEASRPNRPHHNMIQGNVIGLDAARQQSVGMLRNGIVITGGARHHVVGLDADDKGAANVIAFGEGVEKPVAVQISGPKADVSSNVIRGNIIYFVGAGTGHTVGEHGVPDTLALTSARIVGDKLAVEGAVHGAPESSYTVDFYVCPNHEKVQGDIFIGSTAIKTDAAGKATYTASLPMEGAFKSVRAALTTAMGGTGNLSAPVSIAR